MAITSAVCNSFKTEVLEAKHNFLASGGNTFNIALYTSSATLNKSTTAYATNPGGGSNTEITNTSGTAYQPKGKALTSVNPALSTDTARIPKNPKTSIKGITIKKADINPFLKSSELFAANTLCQTP